MSIALSEKNNFYSVQWLLGIGAFFVFGHRRGTAKTPANSVSLQ